MRSGRFLGAVAALWLLLATLGPARAALLPELDTSSPAATYASFLAETHRIEAIYAAYRAAPSLRTELAVVNALLRLGTAVFDLDTFAPDHRWKDAARSVSLLRDILSRIPLVPAAAFPSVNASDPPQHWTIPGTEIRMVRIATGPRAGDYVFSAETVARLPEFYDMVRYDPVLHNAGVASWVETQQRFIGPLLLWLPVNEFPAWLHRPVLDTPLWKLLFVLAFMVLAAWVFVIWHRWVLRASAATHGLRRHALRLTGPILLATLTFAGHFVASLQLALPSPIGDWETTLATILFYLAGAWAAWIAWWLLAEAMIASPIFPDDLYDANLLRLLARVGSLVSAATLIVYGANDIGVPALGLLAGVSVGGIALALAAQSTVENLFGGVSIFADRPFRLGDFIRYGTDSGTVEAIGPRSSRIRGLDGTLTSVPNAELAKMRLTNFTARDKTLFQHKVGVRYETSREQLQALLERLRERVVAHPDVEKTATLPRIRLVGLGASSVDIEIFAKVLVVDFASFLRVQEELILEIMRTVEECGTAFAFPSTTAYFARDPGLDAAVGRGAAEDGALPPIRGG
ncbi:mechanosensitive ion channel family protein [Roseomonas sp. HJA6]|uniref:Mechanosensitive ion channel family protein n=1 Tax=Roseomonas alba TaxID=2846776 RepID=A0ABS7AC04_9PROT|nr:mechanosensitive ion channel family protein [Neoroseomonas alba]MBW6399698.1 mechanosensitive ion channel family protein [Neoroseomonas alba]